MLCGKEEFLSLKLPTEDRLHPSTESTNQLLLDSFSQIDQRKKTTPLIYAIGIQ